MIAEKHKALQAWMCATVALFVTAGCAVNPPTQQPLPPTPNPSSAVTPSAEQPASPEVRPQVPPPPEPASHRTVPPKPAPVVEGVIAQNERFILYRTKQNDTLRSLAQQYLGDKLRSWEIADFNAVRELVPGKLVAIPRQPVNPVGVFPDGYQMVPILCYHRFGNKDNKMVVAPGAFAAQMKYLADNDYRVIRLADLREFLAGKRSLPRRAVVITMDDGYASVFKHAFPLLKQYGFPATIFVYTDFAGGGDALTWTQMKQLIDSGLVDVESHSKSHASLVAKLPDESDSDYRTRLDKELMAGRDILNKKLGVNVSIFAYPYGDVDEMVVKHAEKSGYRLAVTVNPGGNPFFAHPLLLQRTMIFGDHDIEAFEARLQTFRKEDLK